MIEEISVQGRLLAVILRASYSEPGIHFFTLEDSALQLGHMRWPAGKLIEPHLHNEVERTILQTQEVLFVRRGSARVDFYDDHRSYLQSRILYPGDVILLSSGGHGFEALEELEMIEVKQGPYVGGRDKTRFVGEKPAQLVFDKSRA
ncbi:MAG TPA: hypothetical protein VEH07_04595 [Alphaproteobacteria bacterium]|nr:hypothetical protein [Alphaproteobacteria bacterium]